MQSKATSVKEYLASLPDDRRAALSAVRDVVLKNLDKDYEEGVQYGMIGYYVPHRIYPSGYHCDPKQPLPYLGIGSQKNHMSIYFMGLYCGSADTNNGDNEHTRWFKAAWQKTGKKLDMGKACLRFKKLDDLALDVIGQAVHRIPAQQYIATYEEILSTMKSRPKKAATAKPAAKKTPAAKPAARKIAEKRV